MSKKQFDYAVKEIGEGIYLIDEFYSSMFLIVGENRALVLDCGTGVGDFKRCIDKLTSLPYAIALTHAHVDHAGGRGQFYSLYVSAADAPLVSKVGLGIRKSYALLSKFTLGTHFKGIKIQKTEKEPKLEIIKEGDTFDLGGRVITVYETPGHTQGSLSYLDSKTRTIFIGDVANEFLLMFLPHASTIDEMIKTHERLLDLDCYDTIWSSHHNQSQTKADVEKYCEGGRKISAGRKKNSILIPIKIAKNDGGVIIYRPTNVH